MGKQEAERRTQWQENNKTSSKMSSSQTKPTASFQEQSRIYGTFLSYNRKYSQQKDEKFSIKASFTEIYN